MEVSNDPSRLREEVRYLRRRLQYLQSVSTVFRQRISLLLREVAEDPSRVRDLHAAYTALLSETALAEKQDSFDPKYDGGGSGGNTPGGKQFSSSPAGGHSSPYNRSGGGAGGSNTDPVRAREDVRRAHHLCTILQERNELKKRELELEQVNRELLNRLDEYEKPGNSSRASAVAARSAKPAVQSQMQQRFRAGGGTYHQDVNNTNGGLINTPRDGDLLDGNNGGGGGRSGSQESDRQSNASSAVPGTSLLRSLGGDHHSHAAHLVATQKQNSLLKSRVSRLKQELDEAQRARESSVMDLQASLDQLNHQLQGLKAEVSRHQREAAESNRAKLDAQKELLFQKSREELLMAKLNSSSGRGGGGMMMIAGGAAATPETAAASSQLVQTLSHQLQDRDQALSMCDARINDLEDQLRDSETKRASKDVEIAALGAQIKGLRARLDTFDAERSSSQVQQSLIADVHDRLLGAVTEMQQGASSDNLARSLTDVSGKLDRLEALELQLRQKEDMLALADDEVARSHTMQQQLKEALAAFSPLFLQLPKSADALERLVIERDELLAELRKSAGESRAPDLNAVEGRVELRTLQTNSQRSQPGTSALGGATHVSGMPAVPPLPPLLDLRAEAHQRRGNDHGGAGAGGSSSSPGSGGRRKDKPDIDAIPLTHLTPADVSATFRMFAPPGSAPDTRLVGEPLRLCFAALGVGMPRAAANYSQTGPDQFSMSESELVAYIVQQQPQHQQSQ